MAHSVHVDIRQLTAALGRRIVVAVVLVLYGVVMLAIVSPHIQAAAKSVSVPARTLTVARGALEFSGLELRPNGDRLQVSGRMVNKTDRYIYDAEFKVVLRDHEGTVINIVGPGTTWVENVASGQSKPLPSWVRGGIALLEYGIARPKDATGVDFELLSISMSALYSFELKDAATPGLLRQEDENVAIDFGFPTAMRHIEDAGPGISAITLKIQNKTSVAMKVDWNQASVIDVSGVARPVMHTGVRYPDKAVRMEPTVIPPTALIEDFVVPKDNVTFVPSRRVGSFTIQEAGWDLGTLLPLKVAEAQPLVGKTIGLYLPLEIDGKPAAKTFTFTIAKVE